MPLIPLFVMIVLAFASYRITRFIVIDDLPEATRDKVHAFLINRQSKNGKLSFLWEKLYQLTSCTFCTGFWVTAGLYAMYAWGSNASWQVHFISIFAIAGLQSLLHTWEQD